MKLKLFSAILLSILLNSCIGTDVIQDEIEPTLRIENPINNIIVSDTHLFTSIYLNNVGTEESTTTSWSSSDEAIISINANTGVATAIKAGQATITTVTTAGIIVSSETNTITVVPPTLTIANPISVLSMNENYTFNFTHFNTETLKNSTTINWTSSDNTVINVDETTGTATALKEGSATITVQSTNSTPVLTDEIQVEVKLSTFKINNPITTLAATNTHTFTTLYTDGTGATQPATVTWSSSDNTIITVNSTGVATALKEGTATITATTTNTNPIITSQVTINVPEVVVSKTKSGVISTTSSYLLQGAFIVEEINNGANIKITFNSDYKASTALPGLYVYLGNNPNSISSSHEIGAVTTFAGTHSYTLPDNIKLNDYKYILYWCKPFGVKVGDGQIK